MPINCYIDTSSLKARTNHDNKASNLCYKEKTETKTIIDPKISILQGLIKTTIHKTTIYKNKTKQTLKQNLKKKTKTKLHKYTRLINKKINKTK